MMQKYNPRHIGDPEQFLKSFLSGSLATSSILVIILSQNEIIILSMVAFLLIAVLMFIDILMRRDKYLYFFSDVFFFILGAIVSLCSNVYGLVGYYFAFVAVLTFLILFHAIISKMLKK